MSKKALDNITSHFRNKISGEMKSVEVPEWDMTFYYKTTSTLAEQSKIIDLAQKGSTVEALVETLIVKARDKEGNKIFKPIEKTVLMNEADPDVLIRVVGQMNNTIDADTQEMIEKNLEQI